MAHKVKAVERLLKFDKESRPVQILISILTARDIVGSDVVYVTKKKDWLSSVLFVYSLITFSVVRFEDLHALFELSVLMVFDERGADAKTFLMRTGGDEADGRDAIVHQLLG